jgi:hypothetical protein
MVVTIATWTGKAPAAPNHTTRGQPRVDMTSPEDHQIAFLIVSEVTGVGDRTSILSGVEQGLMFIPLALRWTHCET